MGRAEKRNYGSSRAGPKNIVILPSLLGMDGKHNYQKFLGRSLQTAEAEAQGNLFQVDYLCRERRRVCTGVEPLVPEGQEVGVGTMLRAAVPPRDLQQAPAMLCTQHEPPVSLIVTNCCVYCSALICAPITLPPTYQATRERSRAACAQAGAYVPTHREQALSIQMFMSAELLPQLS